MSEEKTNNTMEERAEVTIKFGKGLVSEPFTSKAGKQMVEVKIPNADPDDTRPWEKFVVPAGFVHDNQYGKGVWMKLPEDGSMRLVRNVITGYDDKGRNIWERQERTVTNKELKALVEFYKERNREQEVSAPSSGLGQLEAMKAEMAEKHISGFIPVVDEEMPFR